MLTNILRPRYLLILFGLAAALAVMPWSLLLKGLTPPIEVYSAPAAPALEGVTLTNFQQSVLRTSGSVGSLGINVHVRNRDGTSFGMTLNCEPSPQNPGEIKITFTLNIHERSQTGTYEGNGTCLDPSATGIKALVEKFMDENWKVLGLLNRGYAGFVVETVINIVLATLGM